MIKLICFRFSLPCSDVVWIRDDEVGVLIVMKDYGFHISDWVMSLNIIWIKS